VRESLDIWPLLPIVVDVFIGEVWDKSNGPVEPVDWGKDNIIAALEHNDCICQIEFSEFPSSQSEKVLLAMHRPFPALTLLELEFVDETPVQSDLFLGGFAPHLQTLRLKYFPFPRISKLLLSATHLVRLELWEIPHSGYFSPDVLVTCLSMLTSLECLEIGFESPQSHLNRRLPPQTCTILPILTRLSFNGNHGYLEDLVGQIDAPLLDHLGITIFHIRETTCTLALGLRTLTWGLGTFCTFQYFCF
jgi:hypothetical protein